MTKDLESKSKSENFKMEKAQEVVLTMKTTETWHARFSSEASRYTT